MRRGRKTRPASGWQAILGEARIPSVYRGECQTEAEIEEMVAEDVKAFEGEGYYEIAFSDGGMKWTNDGPLYLATAEELADELRAAYGGATETHLPYAELCPDLAAASEGAARD